MSVPAEKPKKFPTSKDPQVTLLQATSMVPRQSGHDLDMTLGGPETLTNRWGMATVWNPKLLPASPKKGAQKIFQKKC